MERLLFLFYEQHITHTREIWWLLYEITLIRPKDNEIRETPYKKKEYKHKKEKSSNKKEKETRDPNNKEKNSLYYYEYIIPFLFCFLFKLSLFCPFVLCNYFFISFISFTRIGAVTLSLFKSIIQKTFKFSTA